MQWAPRVLANRSLPEALLFTTLNSNQAKATSWDLLPEAGFYVWISWAGKKRVRVSFCVLFLNSQLTVNIQKSSTRAGKHLSPPRVFPVEFSRCFHMHVKGWHVLGMHFQPQALSGVCLRCEAVPSHVSWAVGPSHLKVHFQGNVWNWNRHLIQLYFPSYFSLWPCRNQSRNAESDVPRRTLMSKYYQISRSTLTLSPPPPPPAIATAPLSAQLKMESSALVPSCWQAAVDSQDCKVCLAAGSPASDMSLAANSPS